jgi:CRISPR-associated protein Csx10
MSDPFTADYRIRVKFLSDWHIGSGLERPGSVDRLVQRDVEGFPFVPGKTLTGMFRDAAEEVALRLDGDDPSRSWYRWVLWLFGDQPTRRDKEDRAETLGWRYLHKAQVSIRPAELPSELRDALVGDDPRRRELRDALFVHKPGVKINRQGQAENKHLRLDEMVRGGITLVAPLSVSLDGLQPEQRETARNLVLLAAAFIERVGGKRRRGAGRVEVTISGNDVPSPEAVAARLADFLEPHERPAPLPEETDAQPAPPPNEPRQTAAADTGQPSAETAGDEWGILPFRLTLLTPLLVPERTIGNVVKSLDFVPGTYGPTQQ